MDLRSSRRLGAIAAALLLVAASCDAPRDPEGTLERVTGGTLRVGVAAAEPWVVLGGEPAGIEVELVELFAREIGAEIEWVEGTVEELAAAVHVRELDLLVAGLTSSSGVSSEAALTHPYVTTQVVVATPAGETLRDIVGVEIAVERGTEAAGVLEKTDAVPVPVDDVTLADGPVVVDDFLLDDLGLEDTGTTLLESDHVMAVPHGENGWLVRLERFLLDHAATVERLLEETRP